MANTYESGQLVKIACNFTVSGILTDPTTVKGLFRFNTASATQYVYNTDAQLVKDGTGLYHFNMTAVSAGTYYYRFEGWTAVQAAAEGAFDCLASKF